MREGRGHATSRADAIDRVTRHGRGALVEGLAAARFAVDAVSYALFGCAADRSALEPLWMLLDELGRGLATERPEGDAVLRSLAEALAEETARWEARGRDDPDARAVAWVFAELAGLLREVGAGPTGPRRATRRRRAGSPGTGRPAGSAARSAQRP